MKYRLVVWIALGLPWDCPGIALRSSVNKEDPQNLYNDTFSRNFLGLNKDRKVVSVLTTRNVLVRDAPPERITKILRSGELEVYFSHQPYVFLSR